MKQSNIAIFVICMISIIFTIMGFLLEQKTNILNNRKTELCKLHDSLNKYTGIETKLKNMAKAMIVCFDLSEYEARYYAVIFNDMSIKDSIPEWEIFPATVYVESRFVPNLKSNKGAEGLMQLLDSTAMEQAKILNIQYNKHTINNQFLNVVMGCNYLAEGIKRDGIENAAKYYIAGPKYASRRDTTKAYMDEYDIEVMRKFHELQHEYVKLCYVYKGVISEN